MYCALRRLFIMMKQMRTTVQVFIPKYLLFTLSIFRLFNYLYDEWIS